MRVSKAILLFIYVFFYMPLALAFNPRGPEIRDLSVITMNYLFKRIPFLRRLLARLLNSQNLLNFWPSTFDKQLSTMTKSKGFANFFAFILIVAVAVICASIVDGVIKHRLSARVGLIKWSLESKKVESLETAKIMSCLNEFELEVKATPFFKIDLIRSQVMTVSYIENYTKDSYLSKEELSKLEARNICNVSFLDQSSREVAGKKSK